MAATKRTRGPRIKQSDRLRLPRRRRRKGELCLVAVSDLHVGGVDGLCYPSQQKPGGGTYQANERQLWLFEQWKAAIRRWHHPDALVVVGDATAGSGSQKKLRSALWTTNAMQQAELAADLVNMWHAGLVYLVEGTARHVKIDEETLAVEEYMGRYGLVPKAVVGNGKHYAPAERIVRLGGIAFHLSHFLSGTSSPVSPATAPVREHINALIAEARGWYPRCDVVLRAHRHFYLSVHFGGNRFAVRMPCWQMKTRYERGRNALLWNPMIGALQFRIKDGHVSLDEGCVECPFNAPVPDDVEADRGRDLEAERAALLDPFGDEDE